MADYPLMFIRVLSKKKAGAASLAVPHEESRNVSGSLLTDAEDLSGCAGMPSAGPGACRD